MSILKEKNAIYRYKYHVLGRMGIKLGKATYTFTKTETTFTSKIKRILRFRILSPEMLNKF